MERERLRVSFIGYGAVASVHAAQLAADTSVSLVSVYGPDRAKAATFAARHSIPLATANIEEVLAGTDAVIIASPSSLHVEQTQEALERGVNVLVELPACATSAEALRLFELAQIHNRMLMCAHTSRYLEPYVKIGGWIMSGRLGEIRQVLYVRHLEPRSRSWTDDALLHHSSHPVDLFLHWFQDFAPVACRVAPDARPPQTAMLFGVAKGAIPACVSVSYESRLPRAEMVIVGSENTVITDGFSFVRGTDPDFHYESDADQAYHSAIGRQDRGFVQACGGAGTEVAWTDTIRLVGAMEIFQALSRLR